MVIHDRLNLLSLEQTQLVEGRSWPFQVYLLISEPVPLGELHNRVSQQISDPNMVGIGVDPKGHHTVVRFGKGSGIPEDARKAIAKAGDHFFRKGDWAGGVNSILQAAQEARTSAVTEASKPQGAGTGAYVLVGFVVLFAGLLVFLLWRNKRKEAQRLSQIEEAVQNRPYPPARASTYRSSAPYYPATPRPSEPSRTDPDDVSPNLALTAALVSSVAATSSPEPEPPRRRSSSTTTSTTSSYEAPAPTTYVDTSPAIDTSPTGGGFDGGGSDSSW